MTIHYRRYFTTILCVKTCLIFFWAYEKGYTQNMIEKGLFVVHKSKYAHLLFWKEHSSLLNSSNTNYSRDSYFVYTKGCVIPRRDAFDATVKKYYRKPNYMRKCYASVPLTLQHDKMLYLDNRTISYCQYENIYRKPKSDQQYLINGTYNFTDNVNISSEYIRVTCHDKLGNQNYRNFHYFFQRNESRIAELQQKFKKHITDNNPAEVMNVMMVMMDSVSKLNHIRHMPKTRQFLLKNMSAVDFEGYNKVADNTFVNLVPMLTGNYVEEELDRSNTRPEGPFDKFNLIWKHFASKGYTTMFSEDAPNIATFNYLRRGFRNPPCDHSIRPLALVLNPHWNSGQKCLLNRSETELMLDYTHDFVKTYRKRPYFSLTTITRLTHDYLNHVAFADEYYLHFFQRVQRDNLLNNTIVVFFSDHGHRLSSIINSEIGQFEARMPMMYFVFPTWFKEKYPAMYQNLLDNRNKLTSNFDIHKTLEDILHFTGKTRSNIDVNSRALSLFDPIPDDRSCREADISLHWCVCKMDEIKTQDEFLIKSSVEFTMNQINKEIQNYTMCMPRSLQNVTAFKRLKHTNQVDLTNTYIQLSIVSTPDSAQFQTTLLYNEVTNQFQLLDSISRTNKYKHTADCIQENIVRNYCYCKNQD